MLQLKNKYIPWSHPVLPPGPGCAGGVRGHDAAAGDQATEALAVGEGVSRPHTAARPPARERPREASVALVTRPRAPLDQLGFVSQRGVDIDLVEPPGDHRQQQHHCGEQRREPEGRVRHGRAQRPHVGPSEGPVVGEGETKVEYERAPDRDVVEHGPVRGVQGDLGGDHDHEDGGDHGAEEVMVRQHQAPLVRLVMVGTWAIHLVKISTTIKT